MNKHTVYVGLDVHKESIEIALALRGVFMAIQSAPRVRTGASSSGAP